MVMQQALMSVLIIVQMTHEAARRLTVVEQEKATVIVDDEAAAEAAAAKKADAASGAAAASDRGEQTRSGAAAAAGVRREQTEKQKDWTSGQTKQAGQVASVAAAASIQRVQARSGAVAAAGVRREQTKQDEAGQPASRLPAAIQRNTRSSWPVAITTIVIFMMMSATAGAVEHGLAQQMTTSQQLEWVSKLGAQRSRETGSESGPRATNTIHAQVAGRRATERTASTCDAARHTRGFWPQAGAWAGGPQLGRRGSEITTDVTEIQTVDAPALGR